MIARIILTLYLAVMIGGNHPAFGDTLKEAEQAFEGGDYQKALNLAQALTDAAPGRAGAWRLLARTLAATGEYQWALDAYHRLADVTSGIDLNGEVEAARLEHLLGKTRAAHERLERVVGKVQASEQNTFALDLVAAGDAYRYLASRDPALYPLALDHYEAAVRMDPNDPQALVAMGDLLLDRYNNTEALEAYRAALALDKDHLPALMGLARSQRFDYLPTAGDTLQRCLQLNPAFVDARVLMARMLVDSEDYAEAEGHINRALAVNPRSPDALTLMAAIHYLRDRNAEFDRLVNEIRQTTPGYSKLFQTFAEVAAQNRRYLNAAQFAVMSVTLDPAAWHGHVLVGENRLRLGDMRRGRRSLETAFRGDPYEVRTKNTLDLLDRLERFEVLRSKRFVLIAEPGQASVLAPRLLPLAEQAYDFFAERYDHEPPTPIRIEVYSRSEDFSVRTVGLAGVDILGVSFGPVIALDSPSSGAFSPFNWASALWHEIAHSFHLSLTHSRVPRWFTEGLAVYEERIARPGWGADVSPGFLQAFHEGRLAGIDDLNSVFLRPAYPEQIPHAYYQGSLLMELIERQHGFEAITGMLQGYAAGKTTDELLEEVLGIRGEAIDTGFDAFVRERYGTSLNGLFPETADEDPATAGYVQLLTQARTTLEADSLVDAIGLAERASALFPDHGGPGSAHELLAEAQEMRGDLQAAIARRRASIGIDADDLDGHRELARLYLEAKEPVNAALTLERTLLIQPFDPAIHQRLAELLEDLGEWNAAVRARKAVVALGPADKTGARFRLARALSLADRPEAARRELLHTLEGAPMYEKALELLLLVRQQLKDEVQQINGPEAGTDGLPETTNPRTHEPNQRTIGGYREATE